MVSLTLTNLTTLVLAHTIHELVAQRVFGIIKAEVSRHSGCEPRENPRFVVTNLRQTARWLYESVYCARGDLEDRIKELHHDLGIGRTSCSGFR